jgi:hypothetical protein
VGAVAGVEQVVVGDVRRDDDHYRVDLSLVDTRTGMAVSTLARESSPELDLLISAVQTGVFDLVPDANERAPHAPLAGVEVAPAVSQTAVVSKRPKRDEDSRGRSILPYIAYGSAALAVVAFSAGAVTGTIGSARPEGKGRAEVQADLERRKGYTTAANGLFITGGVLTGVAAVTFVVSWD